MVERVTLLTMQQTVILLIARQGFPISAPMVARLIGKRSENYTRRVVDRMVTDRLLERTGALLVTAGRSAASHRITDHGRAQLAATLEAIDGLRDGITTQRMLAPVRERHATAPVRADYRSDKIIANEPHTYD